MEEKEKEKKYWKGWGAEGTVGDTIWRKSGERILESERRDDGILERVSGTEYGKKSEGGGGGIMYKRGGGIFAVRGVKIHYWNKSGGRIWDMEGRGENHVRKISVGS